jgi:SAM-dependent methyltransferase
VYGIDCCGAMLERAKRLCERAGWHNVKLFQQDAADLQLPEMVDGILFSLSYSVMPEPRASLMQAWQYLRPGRSVVIMDGKLACGILGRLSHPFVSWLSRRTILGDPTRKPWKDLRALTSEIEVEEVSLGTYYICRAKRRSAATTAHMALLNGPSESDCADKAVTLAQKDIGD